MCAGCEYILASVSVPSLEEVDLDVKVEEDTEVKKVEEHVFRVVL